MSSIGKDFKNIITKAIVNKLDWKDYTNSWLESTGQRVTSAEVHEEGNGLLSVRIKTARDGVYYLSIKVTEHI